MLGLSLREKIVIAKECFKQRAKMHDNYCLNRLERWFYTIKTIICMIIERRKCLWAVPESLDVAMLNIRNAYSMDVMGGYDWTEVAVGHGIFRNWHYDIYENSSY